MKKKRKIAIIFKHACVTEGKKSPAAIFLRCTPRVHSEAVWREMWNNMREDGKNVPAQGARVTKGKKSPAAISLRCTLRVHSEAAWRKVWNNMREDGKNVPAQGAHVTKGKKSPAAISLRCTLRVHNEAVWREVCNKREDGGNVPLQAACLCLQPRNQHSLPMEFSHDIPEMTLDITYLKH